MKANARASNAQPELAPPGAGIPLVERLVAKYIIFPHRFRTTTTQQAIVDFESESRMIVELASGLSPSSLDEKRLVPRLRGLEDSSRYWSVAMTIEHLIIVGNAMRRIIFALSHENSELPTSRIEDVKPSANVDSSTVLNRYETMTTKFIRTTQSLDFDKATHTRHAHPWFGELTARQWLSFAAPHQRIHRNQIKHIISRL